MSNKPIDQKLSRDDIIASVADLIAEQGLEALTMRTIASHVGCSVGTLPHYFDGKEDIVIAALNWSSERIMSRLEAMNENDIALENLYPLLKASMPTDELSDKEWRIRLCLWDYSTTNEEMRMSVNAMADVVADLLTGMVGYLQLRKEINQDSDPSVLALTFYHMCIGAGFSMLHTPFSKREELLQPLFHFIESIKIND